MLLIDFILWLVVALFFGFITGENTKKGYLVSFIGATIGAIVGLGLTLVLLLSNQDFRQGLSTITERICNSGEIVEDKFGKKENICSNYTDVETPVYQYVYQQAKIGIIGASVIGCFVAPVIYGASQTKRRKLKDDLPR